MKDTTHIFIPALYLLTSQEISQQFHMFSKEKKMLEPRAPASQDYLDLFWDEKRDNWTIFCQFFARFKSMVGLYSSILK